MKIFKNIALTVFSFFAISLATAQDKPASSLEKATGTINGANIEINYSSPSVKGRKVWGELVPFDQVWRAGANEATTFKTDKDITIAGLKLPAGKYSFFIIPNQAECIVIFNKEVKQWGAYKYNEKKDQLRVKVKPEFINTSIEKLVYNINGDNVILSWDNMNIGFTVK